MGQAVISRGLSTKINDVICLIESIGMTCFLLYGKEIKTGTTNQILIDTTKRFYLGLDIVFESVNIFMSGIQGTVSGHLCAVTVELQNQMIKQVKAANPDADTTEAEKRQSDGLKERF